MTILRPFAAFFTAVVAGIIVDRDEKDSAKQESPELIPSAVLLPKNDHLQELTACGCGSDCGCSSPEQTTQHGDSGCGCSSTEQTPQSSCSDSNCGCGQEEQRPETLLGKLAGGMQYSFGTLLQGIGFWFIGGVLLAGIFGALIPDGFIERNLGDGFFPLLIMLAAAVPLYVCATASTPIAAALALKGLSPGAALVFLLAGPATNAASFTVVAKLLGKRSAFIYLGSIIGCSLALGMVTNWLYYSLGLSITDWVHTGEEHGHGVFYILSALILLALIAVPKVTALIKGESLQGCSQ